MTLGKSTMSSIPVRPDTCHPAEIVRIECYSFRPFFFPASTGSVMITGCNKSPSGVFDAGSTYIGVGGSTRI